MQKRSKSKARPAPAGSPKERELRAQRREHARLIALARRVRTLARQAVAASERLEADMWELAQTIATRQRHVVVPIDTWSGTTRRVRELEDRLANRPAEELESTRELVGEPG